MAGSSCGRQQLWLAAAVAGSVRGDKPPKVPAKESSAVGTVVVALPHAFAPENSTLKKDTERELQMSFKGDLNTW